LQIYEALSDWGIMDLTFFFREDKL